MVKYIGFYVYHRSYYLWSPVIVHYFLLSLKSLFLFLCLGILPPPEVFWSLSVFTRSLKFAFMSFEVKITRFHEAELRWGGAHARLETLLGSQSRFGDKLPRIGVLCPQSGTAALEGLEKKRHQTPENVIPL